MDGRVTFLEVPQGTYSRVKVDGGAPKNGKPTKRNKGFRDNDQLDSELLT